MNQLSPDDPRPTAWPHSADPPQRYWGNYRRYIQRGGKIRLEDDIRGFAGHEKTGDVSRFYFFCAAYDQIAKENIRGDFAELGVYQGQTATVIAAMARRSGATAYLFDTFEGFEPSDLTGIDSTHRMEFADTSLDDVRAVVGEDRVHFVKGYFPDSTAQVSNDLAFALVHIDCDLYTPIVNALKYFYPRIVPGGYLIVHDYFSLAWDGAERAVDEFFADKPEAVIPLTDGGGSVVVRKARAPGTTGNWLATRRCELFSESWVSAGRGGLRQILEDGWSEDEEWGVWGVGPFHTIGLYEATAPAGNIKLFVEGHAALIGTRQSQRVDVIVNGRTLASWIFSAGNNLAVRTVIIPGHEFERHQSGLSYVRITFQPDDLTPIAQLDYQHKDNRALGIALIRMRKESTP